METNKIKQQFKDGLKDSKKNYKELIEIYLKFIAGNMLLWLWFYLFLVGTNYVLPTLPYTARASYILVAFTLLNVLLVGLGWVYLIEYTINRFKNLGKHR
jgi:hypothetical protein